MPAFKYDALDASGKPRQGLLEADTVKAAPISSLPSRVACRVRMCRP